LSGGLKTMNDPPFRAKPPAPTVSGVKMI